MSQFFYSQYAQHSHTAPRFGLLAEDPGVTNAYTALWLRPGAPLPVVKAAYRALAAQYHPDAGGDPIAMQRLNQAYSILQTHLRHA
jgi:DnaJ-class molecular chaperone